MFGPVTCQKDLTVKKELEIIGESPVSTFWAPYVGMDASSQKEILVEQRMKPAGLNKLCHDVFPIFGSKQLHKLSHLYFLWPTIFDKAYEQDYIVEVVEL